MYNWQGDLKTLRRWLVKAAPDSVKIWLKQCAYRLYLSSEKFFKGPFSKYDFQTINIFNRFLTPTSNCVDVGANVGHILREIINAAPLGQHYAFEPIPDLSMRLERKYGKHAKIFNYALSNQEGKGAFMYYRDSPALSSFQERTRWGKHDIVKLEVETKRLDDIIPENVSVDLIKIDVEGAELLVLQGARNTLNRNKPIVLFEAGLGAADENNPTPEQLFDFFTDCGMSVGLMEYHLRGNGAFSREEFCGQFYKGYNYFFIAYDPEKFVNSN